MPDKPRAGGGSCGEERGGSDERAGPRSRTGSKSQGEGTQGSGEGCGFQLTMLSLEAQCESRRPNKGLPALNPDPRFDAVVAICYVIQVTLNSAAS